MARPRKKGGRKSNRSIYIFCEGKKTEPNYFNGLIRALGFPGELADVKVIDCANTDLVGLVEAAKLHNRENQYSLEDDEYWITVDRDGYTKHPEGFAAAKASSIKIAFSSICFEYWLFCHYEYSTKAFERCDNLIKDSLEKNIPGYKKKNDDIYTLTAKNLSNAMKYAKRCQQHWRDVGNGKPVYEFNPYTDVDKLVKKLHDYRKELEA